MKHPETTSNIPQGRVHAEEIGDNHVSSSYDTPLREDAFKLDEDTKIELIQKHFKEIMHILGLEKRHAKPCKCLSLYY